MEPEGPIFSEKQAGEILRRAAELSAASSGDPSGTSLADMERIAAEIGIDPAHVRAAAAELSRAPAGPASGVIDLERVVTGELSDEQWESVVADLRRTFGDPGTASLVGNAREWVLKGDTHNLHASLVSRHGRTRIQLLENHSGGLGLSWAMWAIFSALAILISIAGGAKVGGAEQALLNFLISGGISGGAYLGIRYAAGCWYRAQRRRLDTLMTRIAGRVGESAPVAGERAAISEPVLSRPTEETVEQQLSSRTS